MQGIAYRKGDHRFEGRNAQEVIEVSRRDPDTYMVNRNRRSGTRILIDRLLAGLRPRGYAVEARSHNAVAAALEQGRADWGVLIAPVASAYGLAFIPLVEERFDFVIPDRAWDRPAVIGFRTLLARSDVRSDLAAVGFLVDEGNRP
jgi:putative molybdopterin biosynthesis protein